MTDTTKNPTEAERFMELAGAYDGMSFDWQSSDDPAVVAKLDRAHRSYEPEYGTRYEWPDGSALVEAGDGWDRGIHRDRIDEVQAILDAAQDPDGDALYEPTGCRTPAAYQWATDSEALPDGEDFHYPEGEAEREADQTAFERTTAYEVHDADGKERFGADQLDEAKEAFERKAKQPYGAALWRSYAYGDRWEKVSEDLGPGPEGESA